MTKDDLDAMARAMGARFEMVKNSTKVRLVQASASDADFARLQAECRCAGVQFFAVKQTY